MTRSNPVKLTIVAVFEAVSCEAIWFIRRRDI